MNRMWDVRIAPLAKRLRESLFATLASHFFRRYFTGEMISEENDLRLGIGAIIAILALPGAILPLLLLPKYSSFFRWLMGQRHFDFNTASIPDKYILLTLTMAIMGIVAVLKWQGLFPDRVDYANLAPLPINPWLVFRAKFTALMLFLAVFILAINAVSTVLFPFVVLGNQTSWALFLRFMAAHLVATTAGSAFMFFFFLALTGLLIALLPSRRFTRISSVLQFISIIALVMLLLVIPEITDVLSSPKSPGFLNWLPTVWFLGLYQQLMGTATPHFHALARRALMGLGIAAGMSLVVYLASYQRYFRHLPEAVEKTPRGPGPLKRSVRRFLESTLLRKPFDRACFTFAMKTLVRSQFHRLVLAAFVGLGLAIAIQNVATNWSGAAHIKSATPIAGMLSPALVLIYFLLTGLSFVSNLPAALPANWSFRVSGEFGNEDARRVARKLMTTFLVPIVVAVFALYSAGWGMKIGTEHAAFVLLASALLIEVLLINFAKIPFTCSYAAGKHNGGFVLALYVLGFFVFSTGLAHLEHWALRSRSPLPFLVFAAFLAALLVGVREYAGRLSSEQRILVFRDEPEPVVHSMDLR